MTIFDPCSVTRTSGLAHPSRIHQFLPALETTSQPNAIERDLPPRLQSWLLRLSTILLIYHHLTLGNSIIVQHS